MENGSEFASQTAATFSTDRASEDWVKSFWVSSADYADFCWLQVASQSVARVRKSKVHPY